MAIASVASLASPTNLAWWSGRLQKLQVISDPDMCPQLLHANSLNFEQALLQANPSSISGAGFLPSFTSQIPLLDDVWKNPT